MRIIGITGGVGSGKSEVLRYLNERWGAEILALDEVSRRLLDRDGAGYQKTVELFGRGILKEDGSVDRPAVAKLVFADAELREALNGIIHPLVKEETLVRIADARKRGVRLFVIEAALLIEGNVVYSCRRRGPGGAPPQDPRLRRQPDPRRDGRPAQRGGILRALRAGDRERRGFCGYTG